MLRLHDLARQHLSKAALPRFLEDLLIEVLLGTLHQRLLSVERSSDDEDRRGQAPNTVLSPSHYVLLHHKEKPLCVHLVCIHLRLQSTDLVAPRHRLALDAIGAELHETFV